MTFPIRSDPKWLFIAPNPIRIRSDSVGSNLHIFSVDGPKRGENASVDAEQSMRFRSEENGAFRKRISVAARGQLTTVDNCADSDPAVANRDGG